MSEHKFKDFLRSKNWNGKLNKSFVYNALEADDLPDPDPSDPKAWEEMEAYLRGKDTDEDTIEGVKYIWGVYEKSAT